MKTYGFLSIIVCSALLGCGEKKECVDQSKTGLDKCKSDNDQLQSEVISLKRQLAQAIANPGTIKVDPSLLMIDGKPITVKAQEGTLSQEQVIATWDQNKGLLRQCYERAMKKNTTLTHQKITLVIGFSVKPAGEAGDIMISPNYDSMMNDCIKKAIRRWTFPKFTGQPVGVELPLTLVPKK
jgi:hypothetical protein